jgi:putative transposase
MLLHQVAGSLTGHLGNVKNTYTQLVSGSTLSPDVRHQLHSVNRRNLWFSTEPVTVKQTPKPKPGSEMVGPSGKRGRKSKLVKVVVSPDTMRLARCLIRQALKLHKRPHFRKIQPQMDARASFVQSAHTARHPDWLMLSMGKGKRRLALPLHIHAAFVERNQTAGLYQVLAQGAKTPRQDTGSAFLEDLRVMESKEAKVVNPHPSQYKVPNTVRLLLSEDGQSLRVGLVSDMGPAFDHQTNTYQPATPGKTLCLDLGLSTLFATDCGELHGRNWMERLLVLDKKITGIARHRQQLGLKLSESLRYRQTVQQIRGWLSTQINRILNLLVARKKPARIVLEALNFQNSNLSRRLNRLLSNFGKGVLTRKLVELEAQYGIVTEYRQAAYTSQQCHSCGYVDKKNRSSQTAFCCLFCGLKQHADVQAARTLRDRRSVTVPGVQGAGRRQLLVQLSREFDQRYTRPRGGPADPRFSNPYFKNWQILVRLPDRGSNALFEVPVSST